MCPSTSNKYIISQHLRLMSVDPNLTPIRAADFDAWCVKPFWTPLEACWLLLGYEPIKAEKFYYPDRFEELLADIHASMDAGLLPFELGVGNMDIAIKPNNLIAWGLSEDNQFYFKLHDSHERRRRLLEVYSNVFLMEHLVNTSDDNPFGFHWLGSDEDLRFLHAELLDKRMIKDGYYGMFHEAFCFGVYPHRITWCSTLANLAILLYGLVRKRLIRNHKIAKNAALTFQVLTKDGELLNFKAESFTVAAPNHNKTKNKGEGEVILTSIIMSLLERRKSESK